MRGRLERLERLDSEAVMYAPGQIGSNAGYGREQRDRIGRATQPLELSPAPAGKHFQDRRGDSCADSWQFLQTAEARVLDELAQILLEVVDRARGAPIRVDSERARALLLQQVGGCPQAARNFVVR
jgi:hypothetical protein